MSRVSHRRWLWLEPLEDRLTPSTFTVTNTLDDGSAGSLRWAINQANGDPNPQSLINFNIPVSGVQTILVGSSSAYPGQPLPAITHPSVTVDGSTEGGYNGAPLVVLDGTNAGNPADGLLLGSPLNVVRGLAMVHFSLAGIEITGNGNLIEANYLGTADGQTNEGNVNGIAIDSGASGNSIGGTAAGAGNTISGNINDGVLIRGTGNLLEGNLIGVNSADNAALGNAVGVDIESVSNNTIGGRATGAGNTISGNGDGVDINGGNSNTVVGNFIGTNASGYAGLARSGTVSWYRAEGNANDSVGSNPGTATNVTFSPGQVGQAFSFSGSDSYVSVPDAASLRPTQVSLEAWVKPLDTGVYETLVTKEPLAGSGQVGYGLRQRADNHFAFSVGAEGSSLVFIESTTTFVPGNWYHLVGTYDGSTAQLFVNGNLEATGTGSGTISSSAPLSIGRLNSGNEQFHGLVDEVALFDRVLGDSEVQAAFFANIQGKPDYVGNSGDGIRITDAADNVIGGNSAGTQNIIAGNGGDGVHITGAGAAGNVVAGNLIGTDATGAAAFANFSGVEIEVGASNNTIGGTAAGAGNTLTGNRFAGVHITGSGTMGNLVQGNLIGINSAGTTVLGNGTGVEIDSGASGNTIGGATSRAGNTISSNGTNVDIRDSGTTGNLVQGNLIGTNAAGTAVPDQTFFFSTDVIIHLGASSNIIGGTTPGTGNLISANGNGVLISDSGTTGNLVQGNRIGTNAAGTDALGNATGVFIGANGNTIGGTAPGAGNTISGNTYGVQIVFSASNLVQGNLIGTNSAGAPLPNKLGVIVGDEAINNTIGGPGAGNIIAYNQGTGVQISTNVSDRATLGNAILANAIFGNAGLGIDLAGDGVTPNTFGGPHVGPNALQNYPVLYPYLTAGSVTGTLNSTPNSTFHLEFFANPTADPSGHGQGQDYLGSLAVTTNALGNAVFTFSYMPLPGEPFLTATATDASGNTSEFSASVQDSLASATGTISVAATEAAPFAGVVAAFADGALAGALSSSGYSAVITWGDGSSSPGSLIANGSGFQVLGNHTYSEEGSYPVTVTVSDSDGASVMASGTTTVADASLTTSTRPLTFTEGAAATRTVASFEDADPRGFASDYSVTINWGDSTSSAGTIVADGAGFDISGSHTYPEEGSYTLAITIQDAGGTSVTVNNSAVVSDAALTARGVPRFLVTGGQQFTHLLAAFTDADPAGTVADYAASINWGDHTTSSGTIGTGSGGFTVTGTHTYPVGSGNSYTVTVTITDSGGSTAVVTDSIHDPTRNQVFVIQLYQALLGRDADPAGLAYWSSLLDSGAISRTQVASRIESSPEYRSQEVQALYQQFLHRGADPSGLQYFVQYLGQGGSMEGVATQLVASPEYYGRAGGTLNGFLTALYQDALQRAPDAAGQAAWVQGLDQGASRGQVAAAIFASREYELDLVRGYYGRFLNRPADAAGLAGFVTGLQQGASDADIIAALLGSAEYFTNVL